MFIKSKKHLIIIGLLLMFCFLIVITKNFIDAQNTKKSIQNFMKYTVQNGSHVTAGFNITGELNTNISEQDFLISLEDILISYQTKFDRSLEVCQSPDQIIYVYDSDNVIVSRIDIRGPRIYLFTLLSQIEEASIEDEYYIFDVSRKGKDEINKLLTDYITQI